MKINTYQKQIIMVVNVLSNIIKMREKIEK